MCEPMTIAAATAAMAATQQVVGFMGKTQQAKTQTAMYERNKTNALAAYRDDIEAANLSTMAANEDSTAQRVDQSKAGVAARSSARVSAGERGIGGLTASAIERDLGFQEGSNIAAINRNQQLDQQRHRLNVSGATNAAESRINSMQKGRKPSVIGLVAGLGQSALQGFSMHQDLTAAKAADAATT